ncbi:MAG: SOS response-associated peptidase [Phycisphaerales bacterium]|nr:MAG: SOS response-associated peptidase [Phycisphaerales bacterium]
MCGRFTLTASGEVVAECFGLAATPGIHPNDNVAPTQSSPVVRLDQGTGERRLELLRWGLIPSWAKDPAIGSRMINARAETVATKPSFRSALRHRRCLVVADGFYEWQKVEGRKRKQPYHIRLNDGRPFAFAGLWERWERPDGDPLDSFTVITTEPNELLRPVHDRMPVILHAGDYAQWLDLHERTPDSLLSLLTAYPAGEMVVHAIPRVPDMR